MKLRFKSRLLFICLFAVIASCSSDNDKGEEYTEIPQPQPEQQSPVILNLDQVPYQNLSDYNFFEGDIKNLTPVYKVIPYSLNSELFTDYAKKKRFIWMPKGTEATYTSDSKILDFPVGTALIKNFYYDNVQPSNTTRIIETRVMIKKTEGWIFANYIWNSDQTGAVLTNEGSETPVEWLNNGINKSITYKIPSHAECAACHTSNSQPVPIGPKPQNLNKSYDYAGGSKNQLQKWIEEGYLKNNVPSNIVSTSNWTDESVPLDVRARSYLDINCAHCHADKSAYLIHLRFGFAETSDPEKMGVCIVSDHFVAPDQTHYIAKQNPGASLIYYRMNTSRLSDMMPRLGRTVIHKEGVQLIEDWINGMDAPCP